MQYGSTKQNQNLGIKKLMVLKKRKKMKIKNKHFHVSNTTLALILERTFNSVNV